MQSNIEDSIRNKLNESKIENEKRNIEKESKGWLKEIISIIGVVSGVFSIFDW